jgi:hypothetical protein
MSWDVDDPYQAWEGKKRDGYTKELLDFFFEREIENIKIFQNYEWAPNILDIDKKNMKIFIEWNVETCNDLIVKGNNLNDICFDWKAQLHKILNDIIEMGYYKMSLYTHCFFIDENNKLKTIDFYSCIKSNDPFIEKKKLVGMMGKESKERFLEAEEGDLINFDIFFKQAIKKYIKWPEDALADFYRTRFND